MTYTEKELRRLAYSPAHSERLIAAQHPDTSPAVLADLARDVIGSVKTAAAKRPELTHSTRRKLIRFGDNKTVGAVLSSLTPDAVRKHYLHELWAAKSKVAEQYAQKHDLRPGGQGTKRQRPEAASKACPTPLKVPYPGKRAALMGAAKTTRKTTTALSVYPCPCGSWHMTSKRKPRRAR